MPKENTHVYFADEVLKKTEKARPEIGKIIKDNICSYKIGSYLPDIFFYRKKYSFVSESIHGKNNKKTSLFIFNLLDKTENNDAASLSFIFGILTHFASDITLHPFINSQSRNFYQHIHLETALDEKINQKNSLLLRPEKNLVKNIALFDEIEKYFKIKKGETAKSYRCHYFCNKLFRSKLLYFFLLFLKKTKLFNDKGRLGTFYGSLIYDKIEIKEMPADLLDKAAGLAVEYITSAYDYRKGKIDKSALADIIKGESLSTGKMPS